MVNNLQKEFETLIKTLTTEIAKEVLLEDLKSIRESYQDTHSDFKRVYQAYTQEVEFMKSQLQDFGQYSKVALKHTGELKDLNQNTASIIQKLDEALKTVKVNQESVFDKINQNNENLFKQYKERVSRLNQEEEQRLILAIKNEMLEAERRVSYLNSGIKRLIVETDYNKKKVLEEILDTNEKLAQSYQSKIKAFNEAETVSFFEALDNFISSKIKHREMKIDTLLDTIKEDINIQIQSQRRDINQIVNSVNEFKREQVRMMKNSEKTQLEFKLTIDKSMNQFLAHEKSTLEKINDEVNILLSEQFSKFNEINQKTEKELDRLSEKVKSLNQIVKKSSMRQILWIITITLIVIAFTYFNLS